MRTAFDLSMSSAMHRQHGAALLVALCVMLMLLIAGVSAVRKAVNAEKASRGERDRAIAFHAAEAALTDAERDIEGGAHPGSQRALMIAAGAGFVHGCGSGAGSPGAGLCAHAPRPAPPAWQRVPLAERADEHGVKYGQFTGMAMPVGRASLPSRLPRYIIESLPSSRAGEDASVRTASMFRITAIGFGASEDSQVVLQSYYLKPAEAP